jgi:hypothetical protein
MFDEYGGGESMPLGGYAAILGAYTVGFGSAFFALQRSGRLPLRVEASDVLLLGVATHKLTRTITKDWVTAPLRAPFTEYQDSGIAGEVSERSRGRGLRKAIGDLATCPFCTGPWVAGALVCGLALAPRITRAVAATFAAVAVSDFVHRAYEAAASASESASEAEPAAAEEPRSERVPIRTGAKSKIKATAQT